MTVCSESELRSAVDIGGHVTFCCEGTITLTAPLVLTRDVTLDGTGRAVVLSGGGQTRLLEVGPGVRLEVIHLTLADGLARGADGEEIGEAGEAGRGGAIYNTGGTVVLSSCVVSNNAGLGGYGANGTSDLSPLGNGGDAQGGAIFSMGGALVMNDSLLVSNRVTGGEGGFYNLPGPIGNSGRARGGAVFVDGPTLRVTNCTWKGNAAEAFNDSHPVVARAAGGALTLSSGEAWLMDSTFQENRVAGRYLTRLPVGIGLQPGAFVAGGAVAVLDGVVHALGSTFSGNVAHGGGGFRDARGGEAQGGALYVRGTFYLGSSTVVDNTALAGGGGGSAIPGRGGGIYNEGLLRIDQSTLSGNRAIGATAPDDGTFNDYGSDGLGGGVFNLNLLTLTNSTLALNQALGGVGEYYDNSYLGHSFGAGICSLAGSLSMMNVSLARNILTNFSYEARFQFQPLPNHVALGANLFLSNTTAIAVNTLLTEPYHGDNLWGTLEDGGFNMSSDASCAFSESGSFNSTDPILGPLQNNGGPTFTLLPGEASPAIDFGGVFGAPTVDQRGEPRPVGDGVDIGAVEVAEPQANTHTITVNIEGNGTVLRNPDLPLYPRFSVVTLTASPEAGWLFAGWAGDLEGEDNPTNLFMDGDKTVTARFVPIPEYDLTVEITGQGLVTLNPPGGVYAQGTMVKLTAMPDPGWALLGWGGDIVVTGNPVYVLMNSNTVATATFVLMPRIVSPPESVETNAGTTVEFTVTAEGDGELTYQWFRQQGLVEGGTEPSLILPDVRPSDEGLYWVVVSSPYGMVTSDAAMLTITGSCLGGNALTVCSESELRTAVGLGGVVTFCCNGKITLSAPLEIVTDVILDATGRDVVLSGGGNTRLMELDSGVTLELRHLTLVDGIVHGTNATEPGQEGGSAAGGAIANDGGNLILKSCVLRNHAAIAGHGAFGSSELDLGRGGNGLGGAIFSLQGSLQMTDCLVESNRVMGGVGGSAGIPPYPERSGDGLGGAVYQAGGDLWVSNTVWRANEALAYASGVELALAAGGALAASDGAALEVVDSQFEGNQAQGREADQYDPLSTFPRTPAAGGALALLDGQLLACRTLFLANQALGGNGFRNNRSGEAKGGAIFSRGVVYLMDATVSENTALAGGGGGQSIPGKGGGVFNEGAFIVRRSTLDHNRAIGSTAPSDGTFNDYGSDALGGGIYSDGTLSMTNSTVAHNEAVAGEGEFHSSDYLGHSFGAGIFAAAGTLNLMNVSLARNVLTNASGFGRFQFAPLPNLQAKGANLYISNALATAINTLLAEPGFGENCQGNLVDGGHNMSSDGSCAFDSGTSFNFTDPRLRPLQNYGGPTRTLALLGNSPAIDFGGLAGAPLVDQRGWPRPTKSGLDIGAVEYSDPYVHLEIALEGEEQIVIRFLAFPGRIYSLHESDDLLSWSEVSVFGPFENEQVVSYLPGQTEGFSGFRLLSK